MKTSFLILTCLAASVKGIDYDSKAEKSYELTDSTLTEDEFKKQLASHPIIEKVEPLDESERDHIRLQLVEPEEVISDFKHDEGRNTKKFFNMMRPRSKEEMDLMSAKVNENFEHDFSLQTELSVEESILHLKGEGKIENKNPKVIKKNRNVNITMKHITEVEVAKIDGLTITTTFKPKDQTVEECDALKIGELVDFNVVGYIDPSSATGNKFSVFLDTHNTEIPFSCIVGEEDIIEGFEKGIIGMCQGEKRTIVVAPHLGFGDFESGDVPAGATLHFDVEIIKKWNTDLTQEQEEARHAMLQPNIFAKIDTNKDAFISVDEYAFYFQSKLTKEALAKYFKLEDADGDNKISWGEFTGPKGSKFK